MLGSLSLPSKLLPSLEKPEELLTLDESESLIQGLDETPCPPVMDEEVDGLFPRLVPIMLFAFPAVA